MCLTPLSLHRHPPFPYVECSSYFNRNFYVGGVDLVKKAEMLNSNCHKDRSTASYPTADGEEYIRVRDGILKQQIERPLSQALHNVRVIGRDHR